MTPDEIAKTDIAVLNLLCAQGLPGAEKLDIDACLATLDDWAATVKRVTDRHLYRATDSRYAEHYKRSEAVLRMEMLLQVLQEDLGVHYNMDRVRDVQFTDSRDLFIHGMIADKNGGTCVSMPVLYAAIARRLGYPVKLVLAKEHVFCRWEDGKERWNVEGTDGFNVYDDDFYKKWPTPVSEEEIKRDVYLKSLTPAEELAVFLSARAGCLQDIGRLHESQVAHARAHGLMPASRNYLNGLAIVVQKEIAPILAEKASRRRNEQQTLREIEAINAANRARLEQSAFGFPNPNVPQPTAPNPNASTPNGFYASGVPTVPGQPVAPY